MRLGEPPLDISVTNLAGQRVPLKSLIGEATLLIFLRHLG